MRKKTKELLAIIFLTFQKRLSHSLSEFDLFVPHGDWSSGFVQNVNSSILLRVELFSMLLTKFLVSKLWEGEVNTFASVDWVSTNSANFLFFDIEESNWFFNLFNSVRIFWISTGKVFSLFSGTLNLKKHWSNKYLKRKVFLHFLEQKQAR